MSKWTRGNVWCPPPPLATCAREGGACVCVCVWRGFSRWKTSVRSNLQMKKQELSGSKHMGVGRHVPNRPKQAKIIHKHTQNHRNNPIWKCRVRRGSPRPTFLKRWPVLHRQAPRKELSRLRSDMVQVQVSAQDRTLGGTLVWNLGPGLWYWTHYITFLLFVFSVNTKLPR